jgi:glyoxylate utilization-related uncharacterized protein
MNSLLTTLEHSASVLHATPVLTQNGFTCTLLNLEPGAESTLPPSRSPDDQLLFVVDGDIAVQTQAVTTLVNRGDVFLLVAGSAPVVSAREGRRAQVLRVEIPPRHVVTPQIITPRA